MAASSKLLRKTARKFVRRFGVLGRPFRSCPEVNDARPCRGCKGRAFPHGGG
jgi:hypothetical protein